jgi:two-component system, OmpR family, response regulator
VTRALLIVDDDPDVLTILELALAGADLAVTTAGGGVAAVERFRAGGLDGVLLDVDMPGMDGRAVLLTVLTERPDLPVVFLTANPDTDLAVELCALGARAVLHKPFDPLHIGRVVSDAFGWAA